MEFIKVDSSNISGIQYDADTQQLFIQFKGAKYNRFYAYNEVPVDIWEGLQVADSTGKYFHKHIKNKYDAEIQEDLV